MRALVAKYRRGGVWYLRYSRRIGLPRRSLDTRDERIAEAIRVNEERRYQLARFGITSKLPAKLRYSTLAKLFLASRAGRAANTLESYKYAFNAFGAFLHSDEYVHAIHAERITEFGAERARQGKSPKTVRNELVALASLFSWAVKQGHLAESPMARVKIPRPIHYPPRYLRPQDYRKLMAKIDDEHFRDIVDFYILTGVRRGEGVRLRAGEHVDLTLGIIRLPQPKQGTYKAFPISRELGIVLRRLMPGMSGNGRLIRYSEDYLTHRFRHYAKEAGLPKQMTFHVLRHTFGTWLAATGVSMQTLQQLGGWQDAESVQKYVHPFDEHLGASIAKLRLPKKKARH